MVSADINPDVKQEIKELVAISYNILKEVPPKLEIHCKRGAYFSFKFARSSIELDIDC